MLVSRKNTIVQIELANDLCYSAIKIVTLKIYRRRYISITSLIN